MRIFLYYTCLFKFIKINLNNVEANRANDFLKRYNLFSYQHCVFYRLSIFGFECRKLVNSLETNATKECVYTLCNRNNFKPVQVDLQEGKKTFEYFFSKFLNNFYIKYPDFKFSSFKNFVLKNLNNFYDIYFQPSN